MIVIGIVLTNMRFQPADVFRCHMRFHAPVAVRERFKWLFSAFLLYQESIEGRTVAEQILPVIVWTSGRSMCGSWVALADGCG